jgi:hypothetical protein
MAIIPGNQKIETFNVKKDTTNRTNGKNQSLNQYYTMDDIIETIGGSSVGSPYEIYVAKFQKGLSSWSVKELHNSTGLTFTWSNTNSQTLHADVTGGNLLDEANDIYAWGVVSSPAVISGQDIQLAGVQIQTTQVDIREARIQSDGSGVTDESSFSGVLVIRRMTVTDPVVFN